MKTTILKTIRRFGANARNPMNRAPWLCDLPFIAVLIVWFALSPAAQAVTPVPDGCYPNFTTAEGCDALNALTTGAGNTGLGWRSLFLNSTGNFNTGVGGGTLALNNGNSNTAVGAAALLLNTTGTNNTALGAFTLIANTGSGNTATGSSALGSNADGSLNTATGGGALGSNIAGINNTADEYAALGSTTGNSNTAIGHIAGLNATTGNGNVFRSDAVCPGLLCAFTESASSFSGAGRLLSELRDSRRVRFA